MALTFKKKEVVEEQDELPGEEDGQEEVIDEQDEALKLKLENAEMRGRLSEREKFDKKPEPSVNAHEQTKTTVLRDANNLSDEDFEKTYKMPKHQAVATILDRDNQITREEVRRNNAEAAAKTEMATKYGADFYRFSNEVESALEDLSPEARKDPKRVAAFMERTYRGLAIDKPKSTVPGKEADSSRRKIVKDFEPPKHEKDAGGKDLEVDEDLVEEQHRPLGNALGLRSEKERKMYMEMQAKGGYIPMNLGGGKWFRDPAKGFEIVDTKK